MLNVLVGRDGESPDDVSQMAIMDLLQEYLEVREQEHSVIDVRSILADGSFCRRVQLARLFFSPHLPPPMVLHPLRPCSTSASRIC
jgi:hypothetical protein